MAQPLVNLPWRQLLLPLSLALFLLHLGYGKGCSSGATMAEDLIFDLEADVSSEEEINPDPGPQRCNLRLRF